MKWCCIGFKAAYDSAGQQGSAYLVGRDSLGAPEFLIQFRVVNKGDEARIQTEIRASIIVDCRIVFCPSCGVNLAKFYENDIDALFRADCEIGILKQHQRFILTPRD